MKFGKIFHYLCVFSSGECTDWRVLAQSRTEADAKFDAYVEDCTRKGFSTPITTDLVRVEDDLVLY